MKPVPGFVRPKTRTRIKKLDRTLEVHHGDVPSAELQEYIAHSRAEPTPQTKWWGAAHLSKLDAIIAKTPDRSNISAFVTLASWFVDLMTESFLLPDAVEKLNVGGWKL